MAKGIRMPVSTLLTHHEKAILDINLSPFNFNTTFDNTVEKRMISCLDQ